MVTRRDFSKSVLATGAALLASDAALPASPANPAPQSESAQPAAKFPVSAICGFVGTPVTPFTSNDRVDADTFQKIVDFLVRKGADVISHPMHVGEALSMSVEERKLVAKLTVEAVNGRIPVFIHCSLSGTGDVVELARHAQSIGAQGIVVVTPYFYHPSAAAQVDHFVTVAQSVDIPMIGYRNISVGPLPIEVLPEVIRRCPNFIGLKDAGHEMPYFSEACRVTSALRPDFKMFTGSEYVATSLPVGGAGCFSPISELAPRLVKSLVQACTAGDYNKGRQLQWKVSHLEAILASYGGFTAHKPARAIMGRPCGNPRKPIPTLDKDAVKRLETQLAESGVLDDEPHRWA